MLLVEDDDIDAKAFERSIRRADLRLDVVRARTGEEALALLRGEAPGLGWPRVVLLDLNLPDLTGQELLAAVRRDPELHGTVVFVLTTSDADADLRAAFRHQVAGYFVKAIETGRNSDLMAFLRAYVGLAVFPDEP